MYLPAGIFESGRHIRKIVRFYNTSGSKSSKKTMNITDLLEKVKNGDVSIEEAALQLKMSPFEDLGYAKVDHHRRLRQGACEVIFGESKTAEQILGITEHLTAAGNQNVLITRLSEEKAAAVRAGFSDRAGTDQNAATERISFSYNKAGRIAYTGKLPEPDGIGRIVIATGGTSDIPVAEEAAVTAEVLGNDVLRLYDVGVAGLHRTLAHMDEIMSASVIIAIAGMEGALASVIGGLADAPVIAVPTSVGYGASFGGISALLSMLNSCASGVSVVNIDNGFGAGYQASMINHISGKK